MGTTHTSVLVQPVRDGGRCWRGLFLVDSGATLTMVPSRILHEVGIAPFRRDRCEMADGTPIDLEVGVAMLTVKGTQVAAEVLFGPDDAEPLLGATAMQAANLVWDAHREELIPSSRAKPLKSAPMRSAAAPAP